MEVNITVSERVFDATRVGEHFSNFGVLSRKERDGSKFRFFFGEARGVAEPPVKAAAKKVKLKPLAVSENPAE